LMDLFWCDTFAKTTFQLKADDQRTERVSLFQFFEHFFPSFLVIFFFVYLISLFRIIALLLIDGIANNRKRIYWKNVPFFESLLIFKGFFCMAILSFNCFYKCKDSVGIFWIKRVKYTLFCSITFVVKC
jgi:hypothetical protein